MELSIQTLNTVIHYQNQITMPNKYTLVLANPPFKGSLDYDDVSADLLKVTKTKKTELLFLALIIRMLKAGGRSATIIPMVKLLQPVIIRK